MRRFIPLALLALAACNQQPGGEPVQRIEFGKDGKAVAQTVPTPTPSATPAVASACESVTFEDARFTHCLADPAKHRITTDLGPDGDAPYRSLAKLREGLGDDAKTVAFAMNAGMFDGEGKPIGYYVENGERTQELNRNEGPGNFHMKPNGVFYGANGKWHVRTSDDFYHSVSDRPDFGTQSGPMLVVNGKLHPEISDDGPSKAIRNGVGVDTSGRAHFVISDEPVSFGKLARYFRDVLKTPDALFLDGNVSALWDPASKRTDARAPIGPMIVVEMKAGGAQE